MEIVTSILYPASSSRQHSFSWQSYGTRENGKYRFVMEDKTCWQPSAKDALLGIPPTFILHRLPFLLLDAVCSCTKIEYRRRSLMTSDKREKIKIYNLLK